MAEEKDGQKQPQPRRRTRRAQPPAEATGIGALPAVVRDRLAGAMASIRRKRVAAQKELEEADALEEAIRALFVMFDELLGELQEGSASVQEAATRFSERAQESRTQIEQLLKEEFGDAVSG